MSARLSHLEVEYQDSEASWSASDAERARSGVYPRVNRTASTVPDTTTLGLSL